MAKKSSKISPKASSGKKLQAKKDEQNKEKAKATAVAKPSAKPVQKEFSVVGMGASAGGLEAFEQFFTNTK
ncbi:MAG: hypothetical protein AB1552_13960 [Nitrospirota bacterium]